MILAFLWFLNGCNLYMFTHSGYVVDNIYFNTVLFVVLSIAGFFLGFCFNLIIRAKKLLMLFCVLFGVLAESQGVLIILYKNSDANFGFGIVLLSGFQYVIVLYTLEILTTPARSLGFGFVFFCFLLGVIFGFLALSYFME